ncbi:pentapeptide repeat-containing protein [Nodosilinea sp. AN01ver1]|uniref:pentapeptide repeat-containing protein n=1 Tax=Nodosilinea sp. AN01ver1 TaxID=3423362 RepID=UPI003D31C68B
MQDRKIILMIIQAVLHQVPNMHKSWLRRLIKSIRRLWIWTRPFLRYFLFGIAAFGILLAVPSLEEWLKTKSSLISGALESLEGSAIAGQIEGISIIIAMVLVFTESRKRSHYEAHQVVDSAKGSGTSFARIQALEDLARDGQDIRCLEIEEGANLQGINLTAAKLHKAQLRAVVLTNARLWEANLQEADLTNAHLENANLIGANLIDAVLEGAWLTKARLRGTNLQGADLSHSHLAGADLRGANLQRAIFQGADLAGTKFAGADLKGSSFLGVTFVDANEIRMARDWQDPSIHYSDELKRLLGIRSSP